MDSNETYSNAYGGGLPPQQLPMSKKNKKWRKAHLQWADNKAFFNYSPVRNSVMHKKINYDLLNGKIHMQDIEKVLNPENVVEKVTPAKIPHYPIINAKLQLLIGEESRRLFDYRVIVTDPNSISEIEENKRDAVFQRLQQAILNNIESQEEYEQEINKMQEYFTYEWQDQREIRANALLQHYIKEYNIPLLFMHGFTDALAVGEEIYQCDIVGGEPIIRKLDPLKVRAYRSGLSSNFEDADIIIIEDYWSPGKVIDTFYDVLSEADIKYIEKNNGNFGASATNSMDEVDERLGFVRKDMIDDTITTADFYFSALDNDNTSTMAPYDTYGNIRVIQMYWKSRRKIKKVKMINPETGEEEFNFFSEQYQIHEELGEEETIYYINQAWEGTKIGDEIYLNMRPRVIQYNRLSNPSRCHFGIVGSVYTINSNKPFSMVDMMKPYNYLYDVIHDRLNKAMARNWGKILKLDLAMIPEGWEIDKWLYFAQHNNLAITNSFNEGKTGASMGVLAASLNNNNTGVIDAEIGNMIQGYITTLEFIKGEMSEVTGITRQREGQVYNRETVGGIERANLQSSLITEKLFVIHEDIKKRVLECFLETAKIALKGKQQKFQYLLSTGAQAIMTIDGDEFAESDYGLVVDNSQTSQELNQKLDGLAQAALQNQLISFSDMMKLYTSISLAEKIRMIQNSEREMQERAQYQQQAQMQMQQEQLQAQMQQQQVEMQLKDQLNTRDNETKIIVAQIAAQSGIQQKAMDLADTDDGIKEPEYSQEARDKLAETARQFNAKLELERQKVDINKQQLALNKKKVDNDYEIKKKQLQQRKTTTTK